MTMANYILCIALAVLLAALMVACSSHPAPQATAAAASTASASTAMPASNPLTPLLNTRQRAQSVEKDLKAHDAAERKALKDAQQ